MDLKTILTTAEEQAQALEAGADWTPTGDGRDGRYGRTAGTLRKLAADLRSGAVAAKVVTISESSGPWSAAMHIAAAYGIEPWA